MRRALFSIIALATIGVGTAQAQQLRLTPEPRTYATEEIDTGLSDRFASKQKHGVGEPLFLDQVFVETSLRERIDDGRFTVRIPVLNVDLTTRSKSYYLREGTKQRFEGVYATRILDDRTTLYAGAWLTKYSERFMPRMDKSLSYGISITRKTSWKRR